MAFNLKSIGDIAKTISSVKDIVSGTTNLFNSMNGGAQNKITDTTIAKKHSVKSNTSSSSASKNQGSKRNSNSNLLDTIGDIIDMFD